MADGYKNFALSIYCSAPCLNGQTLEQLEKDLGFLRKHLKISKVYVESHRGPLSVGKERLLELKQFFNSRGIETAGGITTTLPATYREGFERIIGAICYTDNASREKIRGEVEKAASVFDEVILDDFYFTNCACDECIKQRGDRSWETFRLELMTEVSQNLVIKPAKAVNPRVKMIIKYPNWIESFQGTGYNTESQPPIFDGVYTGTETRDPAISQQHIPRYASYSLLRWLDHVKPGANGGGWLDALDCTTIDNYLEQAYLTVFGKAREVTLYNFSLHKDSLYVPPLGFQLEKIDALIGECGKPVGVCVYEPHHAKGEDHLQNYLGMIGIPFEATPIFPDAANEKILFLTAGAAIDEKIISRLKTFLSAGGKSIMTSGFLSRMAGKGIEEFSTVRATDHRIAVNQFAIDTSVCTFDEFSPHTAAINFPVIDYCTNGTWQSIVGVNGDNNIPILMWDNYSRGKLYTLAVPENFADISKLPAMVLTKIRSTFCQQLPVNLDGPGDVSMFMYDNDTFIVETFAKTPRKWKLRIPKDASLTRIFGKGKEPTREIETESQTVYEIKLPPSTFQAFKISRPA